MLTTITLTINQIIRIIKSIKRTIAQFTFTKIHKTTTFLGPSRGT